MNPTPPSDEHPILAELKNPRRMFHQRPEIGFHEFWTTARICEYLSRLNCTLFYGDGLYRDFPEPELLSVWKDKIADNAANIIADTAQFELDLRGETNAICDYLDRRAGEILRGAAQMHAVEAGMTFMADAETAVNSPELMQEVKKAACISGSKKRRSSTASSCPAVKTPPSS